MLFYESRYEFLDEYDLEIMFLLEYEHSRIGYINLVLGYVENFI